MQLLETAGDGLLVGLGLAQLRSNAALQRLRIIRRDIVDLQLFVTLGQAVVGIFDVVHHIVQEQEVVVDVATAVVEGALVTVVVPVEELHLLVPDPVGHLHTLLVGFGRMDAEEVLDIAHTTVRVAVDAGHHGDVREVAVGQDLVAVHQHLEGLVGLPFGDELLGETGVQTTHEGHQTGVVLAMVETRVVEAAPSELVRRMLGVRVLDGIQTAMVVEGLHQGMVETGGVDAAGFPIRARSVADRHQTVGETL